MTTAHVLRGSKQEIADSISRINGEVREAIVFVEEPSQSTPETAGEDTFAEMEPYMVNVPQFNDSREAIYQRMEGE